MVAKIYSAQQQWNEAETHGLSAFKIANLSGQKSVALDAALRLFSIYQQSGKAEKAQVYQQFLVREAKNVPFWIMFNKAELEALGLSPEETNHERK